MKVAILSLMLGVNSIQMNRRVDNGFVQVDFASGVNNEDVT